MIDSAYVNKHIKSILSPEIRKNGFTKVDTRNNWGWHDGAIWVLNISSVGNYFSEVTGWTPMSLQVHLGIYYEYLPYIKKVLILIIALTAFCFGSLFFIFMVIGDSCINEIVCEEISPDGRFIAVGFIRDCGATTDFSPQVSIIKSGEKLPNDGGNIFIGNHSQVLKVKWENEKTLVIKHNVAKDDIFKQEISFGNIIIKYEDF